MPLPTLDDLRAHLNIPGTSDDAELSGVLAAAVNVAEGLVGPLTGTTVTEAHFFPGSTILLRHRPVVAIADVSGGYLPSGYILDAAAGLLRTANGYAFPGTVTVTYTAGRTEVPAASPRGCRIRQPGWRLRTRSQVPAAALGP